MTRSQSRDSPYATDATLPTRLTRPHELSCVLMRSYQQKNAKKVCLLTIESLFLTKVKYETKRPHPQPQQELP